MSNAAPCHCASSSGLCLTSVACASPLQLSPTIAVADEFNSDDSEQGVDMSPVVLRRKSVRDRDPQRQWTRLSWQKHASSCVHLETFESFYHMTPDDFETLFLFLDTKVVDSRARKFLINISMQFLNCHVLKR